MWSIGKLNKPRRDAESPLYNPLIPSSLNTKNAQWKLFLYLCATRNAEFSDCSCYDNYVKKTFHRGFYVGKHTIRVFTSHMGLVTMAVAIPAQAADTICTNDVSFP